MNIQINHGLGLEYLAHHEVRTKSHKGICVSACLAKLGIHPSQYQSTWTVRSKANATYGVLRRHGFAVRSRKSSIPKGATVGGIRTSIRKMQDPPASCYLIHVSGHMLLLSNTGETIIDTAPRKRDRRKVLDIKAVWPK